MTCHVELDGRYYDVELVYEEIPPGGHGWWLRSISGEPRPAGKEVREIYGRALELAEQAMCADRETDR